jgi:hypothetical protein
MKTFKRVALAALVVAALVAGALVARLVMGREGPPRSREAAQRGAPPGWRLAPKERTSSAFQKLNPFRRPSEADAILRDWPPGSRLVRVETEGGEEVELGILPGGEVAVPQGQPHEVTVYYKPEPAAALELRPFVGAGLGTSGPTVMAGVDVLRAWRLHAGVGVAVAFPDRDIAAVGTLSYNVWRNVDVCLAAGYGTAGGVAAAGVSVGLE